MFSHASIIIGLVPTAVTAPVMTRFGKEKMAMGPFEVISMRVVTGTPIGPDDGGAVSFEVSKVPPPTMYVPEPVQGASAACTWLATEARNTTVAR